MTADAPDEWWRAAFADHYSDVYHHRDDAAAAAEIAGLLPRLRAAPGPVLDACCGGGRHLAAMHAAGVAAIGFDFSEHLLERARHRPEGRGRVVRADMRIPPFTSGFGAITLLFTAFGYFDDAGNADCLHRLSALLMPGGFLVLDLPNRLHVAQTLVPVSTRQTPNGLEVRERRRLVGERVQKVVEVARDGIVVSTWRETVRLYTASEILALADMCGLAASDQWPGLHGPDRDEGRAVFWLQASTQDRNQRDSRV